MPGRSAGFTCSLLPGVLLAFATGIAGASESAIVKPADGSWLPEGDLEVIARAEGGQLLLDGEPLEAQEPFPGILHARLKVAPGEHLLRLEGASGSAEVRVEAGDAPQRQGAAPFRHHPPVATACTHCHSLSRRGRFRFSGGCQACHDSEAFIRTHSHQFHELSACGMCHDAHGSSAASLLVLPSEQACQQCHN